MSDIQNIHLLVCIHGMWGNPTHLAEVARIFKKTYAEDATDVLVAQSNRELSTYDGVDWGAERVADELTEHIRKLEGTGKLRVNRFSIVGYSLGGLVARYLVGILEERRFFEKVEPMNFATFATPHVGLVRYNSFMSTWLTRIVPYLLSRTGEQFFTVDRFSSSGQSLVEFMSEPGELFYKTLTKFRAVSFYANAVNDLTVPYVTAAVELTDPFVERKSNGLTVEFDPKYKPIITSYSVPPEAPEQPPPPKALTRKWFRSFFPEKSFLPPPLQRPFPYNILIYMFLPILWPAFILVAFGTISRHRRGSLKRIKLLEAETGPSAEGRLVNALRRLERRVNTAHSFEDFLRPEGGDDSGATTPAVSEGRLSPSLDNDKLQDRVMMEKAAADKSRPVLTDAQKRMVARLNAIPQLNKFRVFIDPIRNSHATIVSRDVANYEFHKQGWGVIQHWADHFIM